MIDFQAVLGEQFISYDDYANCGQANYLYVNFETKQFCIDETKSARHLANKVATDKIEGSVIEQVRGDTTDRFKLRLVVYKSGPKLTDLKKALQGYTRVDKVTKPRVHATGKLGDLYKITHRDTGISIMAFCNQDRTLYPQSAFLQFFNTNVKHRIKKDTPSEMIALMADELTSSDFDKVPVGSNDLCVLTDVNQTVRDYNYHSALKAISTCF